MIKNSTKADCAQKFITWHYMTKNENIRKYEVVGIVEILLTFTKIVCTFRYVLLKFF